MIKMRAHLGVAVKEKVVSPELAAINNLIKEAHSEGTQNALRHRRRSKEIPGGDQAPSSRSTGTEETPTDGAAASDRPSDEKVKVGDGATTGNSEVAAIKYVREAEPLTSSA